MHPGRDDWCSVVGPLGDTGLPMQPHRVYHSRSTAKVSSLK